MMYLGGVLVFCVISTTVFVGANSEWIQELTSPKGLALGSGFSIHLDPLKRENASFLENHALRFDYSGMGLSVEKASDKEAFQVSVYTNDGEQGRGPGHHPAMFIFPAILSFKATGAFILAFLGSTILVLKAVGLAKLAILISAGMWLSKYFVYKPHVEVEQFPAFHAQPVYLADFPSGNENLLSYSNLGNSEYQGAESVGQYAILATPTRNNMSAASKRNDILKRKAKPSVPYLSVKKYTYHH